MPHADVGTTHPSQLKAISDWRNRPAWEKYPIALPCQVRYEKAPTARRSYRPPGPMKQVAVWKPRTWRGQRS